eukprot:3912307-Rhodomonas_salina.1
MSEEQKSDHSRTLRGILREFQVPDLPMTRCALSATNPRQLLPVRYLLNEGSMSLFRCYAVSGTDLRGVLYQVQRFQEQFMHVHSLPTINAAQRSQYEDDPKKKKKDKDELPEVPAPIGACALAGTCNTDLGPVCCLILKVVCAG